MAGGECRHLALLPCPGVIVLLISPHLTLSKALSVLPQTQRQKGSPQDGRGLAPFTPDANSLVVVDCKSGCSRAMQFGWAKRGTWEPRGLRPPALAGSLAFASSRCSSFCQPPQPVCVPTRFSALCFPLPNPPAPAANQPAANEPSCPADPDIYSTIKKSQQNGKIPRFRRVRGGGELYTSDTVMQSEYRSVGSAALPFPAENLGCSGPFW